jgi:hypothetical protein
MGKFTVRAVVVVAVAASLQAHPAQTRGLTDAAAAYLDEYQQQLSFLLADEDYLQQDYVDGRPPETRHLTGEAFLVFVRSSGAWIFLRDVMAIDGQPVQERDDVRAMLRDPDAPGLARTLTAHNSRYNIGRVTRTFNEPTIGLMVLAPEHRRHTRFDKKQIADDQGTAVLTFKETDAPTLIRSTRGRPVFASGEMIVETATGRIRHTVMHLRDESIVVTLTTDYAPDEKLKMWVPVLFIEQYEQRSGRHEIVRGEARYTNYRRFDVTSRIR